MIELTKVEIELSGQPVGKGRPRFTKTGHTYTPHKTKEYERRLHAAAWGQMVKQKVDQTERPVVLEIIAFMEIPKSWPKVKRLEAEYGAISHTSTPDLDNIVKCVADGLIHTVYADDKQIVSIKAQKRYCRPERGPALYVSVSWTDEVKE